MLKIIASEASGENNLEKNSILGLKNHMSAVVRGARTGCAPSPGSASDDNWWPTTLHIVHYQYISKIRYHVLVY